MTNEALEMRLQEIEGVLHGLFTSMAFLTSQKKSDPAFHAEAVKFMENQSVISMWAALSDYSLEQSAAVVQQLLVQGALPPPASE